MVCHWSVRSSGGRALSRWAPASLRHLHEATKTYKKKPAEFTNLSREQRDILSSFLRVDQAGELAATSIYEGQIFVLGSDPQTGKLLKVNTLERAGCCLNFALYRLK